MVFPEGFTYNRKNDTCRSVRVNKIFSRSAEWVRVLAENKNGNNTNCSNVPASVERIGELSNYFERDLKVVIDFINR